MQTVKELRSGLKRGLAKHKNSTEKKYIWYVEHAKRMLAKTDDELQAHLDAMTMRNEQSYQEAEASWYDR